ncbi:MAG: cell division protein ZapA [Betaproteobacteria bacterium]|jgi:cell division protein ZapA|nr:cell division protein ZapA [Burkholderiaceae bacterium]MCZ8111864.1 cell division protein ZapA [Rubrivivax sp.]MCZ8175309.1 cell division protein ZapA [Burkholderiaceae bacterium]
MKQMEFSILGQVYVLGCPEGGEALLAKAVAAVDREMAGIRDAGKVRARERIAVLAALNLAYQLAEQGPSAEAVEAPGAAGVALPQQQVDALVQRLDHALGADGQLL